MIYLLALGVITGVASILALVILTKATNTENTKKEEKTEQRSRFRIPLFQETCEFIHSYSSVRMSGKLVDISSTGIRLHTPEDMLGDENEQITLSLTLGGTLFNRKGTIVRKKQINPHRFEYGICLQHMNEKEHEDLFQVVWKENKKRLAI